MSVLCVISSMIRCALSRMARACGTALSEPRSEVPPPRPPQKLIEGICGMLVTSNCARNSGCASGRSTIRYWLGGRMRSACPFQYSQA